MKAFYKLSDNIELKYKKYFENAEYFNIQKIYDMFKDTTVDFSEFRDGYAKMLVDTPFRLPYQTCVFMVLNPQTEGIVNYLDRICPYIILCEEFVIDSPELPQLIKNTGNQIKAQMAIVIRAFVKGYGCYYSPFLINITMYTDINGKFIDCKLGYWNPRNDVYDNNHPELKNDPELYKDVKSHFIHYLSLVCTTLFAMQVKIVDDTIVAPDTLQQWKRKSSGRAPLVSYHEVNIPTIHRPRSGESFNTWKNRYHKVRGHWKFVQNLFGRGIMGRFWWNPFGRGDVDLGEVFKTYNVSQK